MTASERINKFFNNEEIDRLPMLEWAPWWNLTLDRWYNEGLDRNIPFWEITEHLGLDGMQQTHITDKKSNMPKLAGNEHIANEDDYKRLRETHLFREESITYVLDYYIEKGKEHNEKGFVHWVTFQGFFWLPRTLFGIEAHLYSFYDYPELYHRICEDMTEYFCKAIDMLFPHIKPNFCTFAEDMSYNHGPMLSRACFDEFCLPYYKRVIGKLHEYNTKLIIDSDGDVTSMIPWLIDGMADGVLPLERQAGVDINFLTKEYPDFFFIGGYDKMVMKFGKDAMRREFERLAPAIESGKYIPSVDHQTPPDVPLENYYDYVELLKEYTCKKYC